MQLRYINRCRMIKGFVVMLFFKFFLSLFDRLNPQHFCQGILFLTSWYFVLTVFQVFSVFKFFVITILRNDYFFFSISDLSLPVFEIRHNYESIISSNTLCWLLFMLEGSGKFNFNKWSSFTKSWNLKFNIFCWQNIPR